MSIYEEQNTIENLLLLRTQSREYDNARYKLAWSFVLTAILPTIIAIIMAAFSNDVMEALLTLLVYIALIVNNLIQHSISKITELAASIQQTLDIGLFKLPFKHGVMNETKKVEAIAKYGTVLSESERENLENWYEDYSTEPDFMQVLYCQIINLRWDARLRKRYLWFNRIGGSVLGLITLSIAIFINSGTVSFFLGLSLVLPIIQYFSTQLRYFADDIKRIEPIKQKCEDMESRKDQSDSQEFIMELCDVQMSIYKHRKSATLVPKWFYEFWKKFDEIIEKRIAKNISEPNETIN